jgi:hypothetical protein
MKKLTTIVYLVGVAGIVSEDGIRGIDEIMEQHKYNLSYIR